MNTLSKLATEAHGGLDRWNQLKSVKAHLSVTGAIWRVKGRPDVLKDIRIVLALREQLLTTHFIGQDKRFVFTQVASPSKTNKGISLVSAMIRGAPSKTRQLKLRGMICT